MRYLLSIILLLTIASCGTNQFNSEKAAPKSKVIIQFTATEKFRTLERQPTGYLSKMTKITTRQGKEKYRRSGHHKLRHGVNILELEIGETYALTHLRAGGANGAVYVFCGSTKLPAFTVHSDGEVQAGKDIVFKSSRSANRVFSVQTNIQALTRAKAKSLTGLKVQSKVKHSTVFPSSSCQSNGSTHNVSGYRVPSFYSLIEVKSR